MTRDLKAQFHGFSIREVDLSLAIVFLRERAFVNACHGSSEAQDVQNAVADAESGQPVACVAFQQMSAMRQHRAVAHCMSFVRLLSWSPGVDGGRQIAVAVVVLWAAREFMTALCFTHEATKILALQSAALVRKVSDR